ncbi:MAG: protein kinase [Moorea sp. SIO2B7]|nr:protein kinase [Moorena sp. SIO2B7]
MSYCLNPKCKKPQNPDQGKFCLSCGSRLWLGDRYRAIKVLSEEGIGRTFLAVDEKQIGKPRCIIKQVAPYHQDPENIKKTATQWGQEALKLQEIGKNPQIPELLAYFTPDSPLKVSSLPVLVQEFIEGEPITNEVFDEKEIRQLLDQLLPVLQFVHDHSVIHRDINPANIIRRRQSSSTSSFFESSPLLIEKPGSVSLKKEEDLVLVDFSTAKVKTKTALAKTGTVIGSAAYTAPEQLRGKAVFASDLYSLGITCIYLLTRMHPFDLFSSMDGIWVWEDYVVDPLSDQLRQILNKMIADTVSKRYQSAIEILEDLHPGKITPIPLNYASSSVSYGNISLTHSWKCICTLKGHLSSIHSLSFSPDGKYLASGSADQTIKIWNLKQAQVKHTFSGHSSIVEAVIFSPDGKMLVSGSWDYTIRFWDLETEEEVNLIKEHYGWIKCLVISRNGKIIASGSVDKTIKIWALDRGRLKTNLTGHSGAINSLAISQNGAIIASGSADKTIKIWQGEKGEEKISLTGHSDSVNCLKFSPSGQILISGSQDKSIKIWNLGTGKLLNTLLGHSEGVNAIDINSEGNLLISGSSDKTVTIWHPGSGELLDTLFEHSAGVKAIAISPDGRLFASGSQDKMIKLWQFS